MLREKKVIGFPNEILKRSSESLEELLNGKPVNNNPINEIPQPEITLYGIYGVMNEFYFDTEQERNINLNDDSMENTVTIEYYRKFAGREDVVCIISSDGKKRFAAVADEDYIGHYNHRRSVHQGKHIWEAIPGDLKEVYEAFKKRGIVLTYDIYAKADESKEKILDYCDKNGLFGNQKRKR